MNNLVKQTKIDTFYGYLKSKYPSGQITEERLDFLSTIMQEYGYLPFPYIKALKELTDAEVLFCLEQKWKNEGVFVEGNFDYSDTSVLVRNNVKDSSWIKRECHDIKLINLGGLGNRDSATQTANFMDWLRQIVILPTGNRDNNIFNTTIYLTPFHPRAFGCAYIPQSSGVSPALEDQVLLKEINMNAEEQVKMFINFAQLAGHPVIYDILPQTGRFSKTVLAKPECVRWFNIKTLIKKVCDALDRIYDNSENKVLSQDLINKYPKEKFITVVDIYKKYLSGDRKFVLNDEQKEILQEIHSDKNMQQFKKQISNEMQVKNVQQILQNDAKNVVQKFVQKAFSEVSEKDIINRAEIEVELIKEGLWSLPGGAWDSSGVPVFSHMAKNELYPVMKHYNFEDEDVSKHANLDCQSPFYFVYLENGEYNLEIIDFYIDFVKRLVLDFNFDGIRVDHINHVVDELSEKDGVPISYRIPSMVLKKLNDEMKSTKPHFIAIAEYMLQANYVKEYHQDMNFDVLYGNDITAQCYKSPSVIDVDNTFVGKYNRTLKNQPPISVLKMYNNQDGEYKFINMYPAQLGEQGALFKWFQYKFLPGGYYAQRPMMYVDGDESFSQGGIEETICNEVFMKRNDNMGFFAKFDAIDRFAKNNRIICFGEAHVLRADEDGFVMWQIQNGDPEFVIMVIANSNYPKNVYPDIDGKEGFSIKVGEDVYNKNVQLNENCKFVSEFEFNGTDFEEISLESESPELYFDKLSPAEFKIYKIVRENN